jgi:lauroyl/myristoyl acyltransferase
MARRKVANHWFVSVETPKQSRHELRLHVRQTKAFPTEAEAKQFAKEMLSNEAKIIAGTLLTAYQPKRRIVSGWHLRRWIEQE